MSSRPCPTYDGNSDSIPQRNGGGRGTSSALHRWLAIGESFLWTVGYLAGQGLVLILLMAGLLTYAFGLPWPDSGTILNLILDQELDRSFMLVGATSLGVLFVLLPLVRLREGKNFRERMGWHAPTREQIVYSLATVIPIAIIGDVVYELFRGWPDGIASNTGTLTFPFAAALRETSLQHLYSTFDGVSFPVLVVALALGPAIGEELIFRGVIGRRLVGHFGPVLGIGLTSICFAISHGSPAHALATLPVAILLHWLYLQTGTIWIPVLIHFCNNLLALAFVRFSLASDVPISPVVVATMSLYLISVLLLLNARTKQIATV